MVRRGSAVDRAAVPVARTATVQLGRLATIVPAPEPALGLAHRQDLDPLSSGSDGTHARQRAGEQQRRVPVVRADGLAALFRRGLLVAEALSLCPGGSQVVISGSTDVRTND
jgi:hypothetical protein